MNSEYFFIFEMANNHMGDVSHGLRIIQELKKATEGFDFKFAVKLQYRHLPDFIHPDFRNRTDLKFVKRFSETALSWEDYKRIKDGIVEAGFISMCTPWDEVSVEKIVEHGYDYLKVPSCYLTDWPLAEKIGKTSLPLVISTAGEPFEEIDRVVSFYLHRKKQLSIMHCVGEYPTPISNLQLNQIDLLRQRYKGVPIGYSTHEEPTQLEAIKLAIAKGATLFEKHVGVETDKYKLNAYSANPEQIRLWLGAAKVAREMTGIVGQRYHFSEIEKKTLGDLQRAVFARKVIKATEKIGSLDIFLSIPGTEGQLVANDLSKYVHFRAKRDFAVNEAIRWEDVEFEDHRPGILSIVKEIKQLLSESGTVIPGQLELELSHHYGLQKFREFGSTTITVVNREYCKRVIVMLPGQKHPEQWHNLKDETYHLLHGEIELTLNGSPRSHVKNDVVIIPRKVLHAFVAPKGAVIEEISSAYDQNDSLYTDGTINGNKNRKTYITYWTE